MMENETVIHSQIFRAFFDTYIPLSQQAGEILEKVDEAERREAIAKYAPHASRFLESHTQQELNTKLMILAIASSVASAVLKGLEIYHQQDIQP